MKKKIIQWCGAKPTHCQICKNPLVDYFIDGKTTWGPWAIMCEDCHFENGGKLGVGIGQKYSLNTLCKVGG